MIFGKSLIPPATANLIDPPALSTTDGTGYALPKQNKQADHVLTKQQKNKGKPNLIHYSDLETIKAKDERDYR